MRSWLRAVVFMMVSLTACCTTEPVFPQLLKARRLASELRVEFSRASEAANRAVMADTDEVSIGAATEAKEARSIVERDVDALRAILEALDYRADLRYLDGFTARFAEYRRLDDEILPLAAENTNVKAQRLSFGPAREMAERFRTSLDLAVRTSGAKRTCCVDFVVARAVTAVLEIQVMHARHIAEAEDVEMTRMEERMSASAETARKALEELRTELPSGGQRQLDAAGVALDKFLAIHAEIIALSRRNSNVRSLALSLGRKRIVTAECEDQLRMLEETLTKHDFNATR